MGNIFTASVEHLAALSPDESLQDIQNRTSRFNWFALYAFMGSFALLWLLGVSALWAFLPGAFAMLLAGAAIFGWNRDRRTARLFYDTDDPLMGERLQMVAGAGSWLSKSQCLWHIYHSVSTTDWKHNAGASGLIRRTPIRCEAGSLPRIELNIDAWCVPVGPQRLLFLPDRLLVIEGGRFAGVPYDELDVSSAQASFIEEEGVPQDSPLLEYTWRYVNKSGGPDRRFSNNRQLPVLGYGKLELRSPSGLHVVLQMSNPACADGAARALGALVAQSHSPHPSSVLPSPASAPSRRRR